MRLINNYHSVKNDEELPVHYYPLIGYQNHVYVEMLYKDLNVH